MSFWTVGRRESFRHVLRETFDILGLSADVIDDYARRHTPKYGINASVSKRTVERFLNGQHKTRAHILDAMLVSLADDIERWENLLDSDKERIRELFTMKAEWDRSRQAPSSPSPETSSPNTTDLQIRQAADILLAYLHLSLDSSQNCEQLFFQKNDPRKIHFKTYRYTREEQMVQKSLTVVHRPTETSPITRFANFFDFENGTRASHGIALKFGREVMFFGQSDQGQSAKSLVFNHIAAAQERYTGLVTTNEPNGGAVAARFVMMRTDCTHHSQANTGCFKINDEAIELSAESKERLRNTVPFSLEEEIFDAYGQPVPQKNMVVKVDEMIAEGVLGDGRKLGLHYPDGRNFNPADHDLYTFNSALKIRD